MTSQLSSIENKTPKADVSTYVNKAATVASHTGNAHAIETTRNAAWLASKSLCWREIVRFLRQRNRVIGAVGQPILFWLLFGTGLNQSFQFSEQRFGEYFVPGTTVLIVLFTAIFATISIIEDRKEGFLQSVLVAPVPRWSAVLGKVAGGSILATGQALIFLLLALLLVPFPGLANFAGAVLVMAIASWGLTSLGFCLAWRLDSTQGFHAIMNLLLMPMWLLSGAFFPLPELVNATTGERLLHWVMRANPVTYVVAGLRRLLSPGVAEGSEIWLPRFSTCCIVTVAFAIVMFWCACSIARTVTRGDLR